MLQYGSVVVLFFLTHSFVFAATSVSFTGLPTTVDEVQEFETDVTLICSGCSSDSYLRAVFYPSGSSYFGYTQNNSGTWVNASGGSCTEYFKIASSDLIEGSWSGKLKMKPDNANSFYSRPGEYLFKIGRYTNSCGTPTWSSEKIITITGPTATPTPPNPTATNISSPTPTHTASPSKTPTPTVTHTIMPMKKPTSTPVVSVRDTQSPTSIPSPTGVVLGDQDVQTNNKPYIIALLFISVGCALLATVFVIKNRLYLKK